MTSHLLMACMLVEYIAQTSMHCSAASNQVREPNPALCHPKDAVYSSPAQGAYSGLPDRMHMDPTLQLSLSHQ